MKQVLCQATKPLSVCLCLLSYCGFGAGTEVDRPFRLGTFVAKWDAGSCRFRRGTTLCLRERGINRGGYLTDRTGHSAPMQWSDSSSKAAQEHRRLATAAPPPVCPPGRAISQLHSCPFARFCQKDLVAYLNILLKWQSPQHCFISPAGTV